MVCFVPILRNAVQFRWHLWSYVVGAVQDWVPAHGWLIGICWTSTIPTFDELAWHTKIGTKSEGISSSVVKDRGGTIWAVANRVTIKRQALGSAWNPTLWLAVSSWASYFSESQFLHQTNKQTKKNSKVIGVSLPLGVLVRIRVNWCIQITHYWNITGAQNGSYNHGVEGTELAKATE